MNILLTGANGFIGKVLSKQLEENGITVNQVVRDYLGATDNANFFIKEINAQTDWQDALHMVDAVIHLAARAHVVEKVNLDFPDLYTEINYLGALNLATQAAKACVKRFVFISSIRVNGNETITPFNEVQATNPKEPYAVSKNKAEIGLRQLAITSGLEVVIIRPPLVYGKNPKGNFKKLIGLCQSNLPLPFGAINNKRSLIYIENLVDFIMLCTHHPKAANETFVIADGNDVSTTDLIKVIREASGNRPRLIPIPQTLLVWLLKCLGKHALATRLCGNLQIDISKAKTLLGWKPPYTFKEGIARTMQDQVK